MMSDKSNSERVARVVEQYDEVSEELEGREVTLVYDSVYSDGNVEFTGTLDRFNDSEWIVKGWDDSRRGWYGAVRNSEGRRVGGFVRLEVHPSEDADASEDSEDGEPMTDGGVQMASHSPTRVVEGFAPFVERALNQREAVEALGPDRSPGREPRGSDGGCGWSAARTAGKRVAGQSHPLID